MPRDTPLKRTLFACDELSGFVHACGLVRPTGLDGLEPKSVRKKLKQPSFAAGVHRDEVYAGAELLGLELDEHIANVIAGAAADRAGARAPHRGRRRLAAVGRHDERAAGRRRRARHEARVRSGHVPSAPSGGRGDARQRLPPWAEHLASSRSAASSM